MPLAIFTTRCETLNIFFLKVFAMCCVLYCCKREYFSREWEILVISTHLIWEGNVS